MVPTRKQQNNILAKTQNSNGRSSSVGRPQVAFESRKNQQKGQQDTHLSHFIDSPKNGTVLNNEASDNLQEMYSHQNEMRRILKKPLPLNHISGSNNSSQRQDPATPNDVFISSPSYPNKNTEAPLLQHASKINRSNMKILRNDSKDALLNNSRKIPPRVSMRQDSSISSDSFSQTSSPSYNTKIMEAPLLSHASRMHKVKPVLKNTDEIVKDEPVVETIANNSAIIKSASTPASLQTIVRLSNGSNVSLQHKVGGPNT
jgi:corin